MNNSLVLLFVSVFLAACGQVTLKHGVMRLAEKAGDFSFKLLLTRPHLILTSPVLLAGIALFISSAAFWMVVLSKVPLSKAYPMVAFGYILVAVASRFAFGEHISLMRILGLVLICAGVVVMSRS